jgi:ABC-type multidrug transport system fused ATPase/permease subunit
MKKSVEDDKNFFKKIYYLITFSFLDSIILKSFQKNRLENEDVFQLREDDKTQSQFTNVNIEGNINKFQLLKIIIPKWKTMMNGILFLVYLVSSTSIPFLLKNFLESVNNLKEPLYIGILLALLLFLLNTIKTISMGFYQMEMLRVKLRLKIGIQSLVFKKMLKMSNKSFQSVQTGEIVNLMSIDSDKVADAISKANFFWSLPLTLIRI